MTEATVTSPFGRPAGEVKMSPSLDLCTPRRSITAAGSLTPTRRNRCRGYCFPTRAAATNESRASAGIDNSARCSSHCNYARHPLRLLFLRRDDTPLAPRRFCYRVPVTHYSSALSSCLGDTAKKIARQNVAAAFLIFKGEMLHLYFLGDNIFIW